MTDEELRQWQAKDDGDLEDGLMVHFEKMGLSDWGDIGREFLRVAALMGGGRPEAESPMDYCATAAIAHAFSCGVRMAGKFLDIKDEGAFESLVQEFEDGDRRATSDLSAINAAIKEKRKFINDVESGVS